MTLFYSPFNHRSLKGNVTASSFGMIIADLLPLIIGTALWLVAPRCLSLSFLFLLFMQVARDCMRLWNQISEFTCLALLCLMFLCVPFSHLLATAFLESSKSFFKNHKGYYWFILCCRIKCENILRQRPYFRHLTKTPFKKPIDFWTVKPELLKCLPAGFGLPNYIMPLDLENA